MDRKEIGRRIQKSRNEAGYTQEELSENVGLSPGFIAAIERGAKMPGLENLIRIAEALNVSVDWLLGIRRKTPENREVFYLDEEIRGLPVCAQKRIQSVVETMVDYEKQIEKERRK